MRLGDKRRLWTLEEERYMADNYLEIGAVEMARKLGRSAGGVRLKAQNMGIVRQGYFKKFEDCFGATLNPGDVVTLEGQKTRSTVVELIRRGIHRGTVRLDPPLRYTHHAPEELERVERQPRKVVEAMEPTTPDTAAFNAWLRASRVRE